MTICTGKEENLLKKVAAVIYFSGFILIVNGYTYFFYLWTSLIISEVFQHFSRSHKRVASCFSHFYFHLAFSFPFLFSLSNKYVPTSLAVYTKFSYLNCYYGWTDDFSHILICTRVVIVFRISCVISPKVSISIERSH